MPDLKFSSHIHASYHLNAGNSDELILTRALSIFKALKAAIKMLNS